MNWQMVGGFLVAGFFLGFIKPAIPPDVHLYASLGTYLLVWLIARKKPELSSKPSRIPMILAVIASFALLAVAMRIFPSAAGVFAFCQLLLMAGAVAYVCSVTVRSWVDTRVLRR